MSELFKQWPTTLGRQALAGICRERGLTKTAVEIGVWRGDFSRPFFDEWDGEKMYLIDPWQPPAGYVDIRADEHDPSDYQYVMDRFIGFQERVNILKTTSKLALRHGFVPNDLSFVYIDGDHSFNAVLFDMINWYEKLAPGGILAGHDLFAPELCGVTNAVVEFARLHNEIDSVHVIADNYDSWFVIKP